MWALMETFLSFYSRYSFPLMKFLSIFHAISIKSLKVGMKVKSKRTYRITFLLILDFRRIHNLIIFLLAWVEKINQNWIYLSQHESQLIVWPRNSVPSTMFLSLNYPISWNVVSRQVLNRNPSEEDLPIEFQWSHLLPCCPILFYEPW